MANILLLIDSPDDRDDLRRCLGSHHAVVTPAREAHHLALEGETDFDLIFVGPAALQRLSEPLSSLIDEASPLFLPLVLLVSLKRAEKVPEQSWETIDEVVTIPYLEQELGARVQTLLRARRLSLLAHAELSQIFDSVDSAMCVIDRKLRVRRSNRAFAELIDRRRRDIRGRPAAELLNTTEFQPALDAVKRVLAHEATAEHELEIPRGDGSHRSFLLNTNPLLGLDGELTSAILELKEVTALKQTTRELIDKKNELESAITELRELQGHLVRQERLHALEQMASGVVHDFNNTLSVIIGHTEMLLSEKEPPPDRETRRSLDVIHRTARDAAFIVKGLRGFYKGRDVDEPGELVDLNDIVEEVITLTRPKWRQRASSIEIVHNLRRVPRFMANGTELREAVTNLVFNAVDAMPSGGRITFDTSREQDTALLVVSDTGVGMDQETAQHALEPFFTTKGRDGTGMGLAMVYGIVSRHRGAMSLESRLGEGTTVAIRLPLTSEASDPLPEISEPRTPRPPLAPLRLLVVDDHAEVRESLAGQLRRMGHEVMEAGDGITGLDVFQEDHFDVVITDRIMPNLDGVRFAAVLKATSPETPVIMLSGFDDDDSPRKPANIDILLRKPATSEQLMTALSAVVTDSPPTSETS